MRSLLARSSVAAGLIALSACGGGSSTPTSTATPSPITISIVRRDGARSFSPNPAQAGGQMVVFRNDDTIVHRVRLNDLSIDTGDIAPRASSRAILMPSEGTNYHCGIHPDMIGSVNASGGAPPPPCRGVYCG